MDWTGGVRRRYAPGKNNVTVQKQKAYFAKARAALQDKTGSNHSLVPRSHRKSKASAATQHSKHPRRRSYSSSRHERGGAGRQIVSKAEQNSQKSKSHRTHNAHSESSHHRLPHQKSPSIISLSSRRTPSSTVSSTYQKPPQKQWSRSPERESVAEVSEEERLLLANRRRLLARTDWLGLTAGRPVAMKFASSHDKDRIGKRRKIEKTTSRKGQPAGQRFLTPLFERRLDSAGLDISGKPFSDSIRIKIGTDALASQTQMSRRSRTPGKTSMRHPSTEFGPLSEESMLLGSEGEVFEVLGSQSPAHYIAESNMPEAEAFPARASIQMSTEAIEAPDYQHQRAMTPPAPNMVPHSRVGAIQDYDMHHIHYPGLTPVLELPLHHSEQKGESANVPMSIYDNGTFENQLSQHLSVKPTHYDTAATQSVEGDNRWRKMFNINSPRTSLSSMKALKSSSMHVTTSESSHRPHLEADTNTTDDVQPFLSTPKGAGTQGSMLLVAQELPTEDVSCTRSNDLHSPSASLRQIRRLANTPAGVQPNDEEVNDNALWRQFIIGSQDSSDEPENFIEGEGHIDNGKGAIPNRSGSSEFNVSGLGTSIGSTLGDTVLVNNTTPNLCGGTIDRPDYTRQLRATSDTRAVEAERNDDDSTGAYHLPNEQKVRGNNIHASKQSVLNPKMFKKSSRDVTNAASKSRRHVTSVKTKPKIRQQDYSVYDLIDSD